MILKDLIPVGIIIDATRNIYKCHVYRYKKNNHIPIITDIKRISILSTKKSVTNSSC